jgi:hypothetical protein
MLKLKTGQVVEGLGIRSVFEPDPAFQKTEKIYIFRTNISCLLPKGNDTVQNLTESNRNQIEPESDRTGTRSNLNQIQQKKSRIRNRRPSCFDFTKYLCTYDKVEPIWFNNTYQLAVDPVTLSTNGVMHCKQ